MDTRTHACHAATGYERVLHTQAGGHARMTGARTRARAHSVLRWLQLAHLEPLKRPHTAVEHRDRVCHVLSRKGENRARTRTHET